MKTALSRALMALAIGSMGEHRRGWSAAMDAEYRVAAADGQALPFAAGCLAAAWRETLTTARGHFLLTSYAVALGIMLPMAALQIGCAVLGFPYLYPGPDGLSGALLEGGDHQALLRGVYLAAIPSLALIQLITGVGHLRLAWLLLERDWPGALRWSLRTLAAAVSLVVFMGVLFIDGRQALLQGAVVVVELTILTIVLRWHADLTPAAMPELSG